MELAEYTMNADRTRLPKKSVVMGFLCVAVLGPSAWGQDHPFIWPLSRSKDGSALLDRLNSPFGPRIRPSDDQYELHPGIDLAGPKGGQVSTGDPVFAAANGTVDLLTDDAGCVIHKSNATAHSPCTPQYPGGGRIVRLSHGKNLYTLYLHLWRQAAGLKTTPGAQTIVRMGDQIGAVGKTGQHAAIPHLHFEVREGGTEQDFAKNPLGYLPRAVNKPPVITALSVPSVGGAANVSADIENNPDGCRLAPDCDVDLNRIVLRIRDGAGTQIEEKAVDFNRRENVSADNPENNHIAIVPIKRFNRSNSIYRWTVDFKNVVAISPATYEVQATDVLGLCASRHVQTGVAPALVPYCSLGDYIQDLKEKIPDKSTNCFIPPSEPEVDAFRSGLHKLLKLRAGDDIREVMSDFDALNYDLKVLSDNSDKSYWVVQERGKHSREACEKPFRGLGTYIVDSAFKRNVIVEVPHPLFDSNTPEEGTKVFQELGARALFIAGTHRCANPETESGCSGRNEGCGARMTSRISDAAHSTGNFFYSAHDAGLRLAPTPTFLNLHGNSQKGPDIILSDGTTSSAQTLLVNKLRDALLDRAVKVKSCNAPKDGPERNLCGTDNVQGRLSNGSPEPCTKHADKASGTFLHIEQHKNIREDPSVLIKALQDVLPQ